MSPPVQALSIETVGRDHWARRCRKHQIRTNLFVRTVCRFAGGTPGRRALRTVYRTLAVGRDHWARRVQELPILSHLFVPGGRPPVQ